MKGFAKFANKMAEKIYNTLGKSSGKMLLATSMIGISMSSFIQAAAVLFNDKYSTSQKAFMIPQELGDAVLSIVSIFAITKPTQKIASKLVKSGKLLPKNLVEYIGDNKLAAKRGKSDFNLSDEIKTIINNVENSDKFIKSNQAEQHSLISKHVNALNDFEVFADSVSAIATTAAGITSTCLVVPTLRNIVASKYQRKNLDYINNKNTNPVKQQNPTFKGSVYSNSSLFGFKI